MRALAAKLRTAAWLGWQIESNWADTLTFAVYSVLRPLGGALILAGIYWAASGGASKRAGFAAFFLANAFHEYVVRILVGMGWIVVEEREEYETLKYVVTSPIGMFTYLWGRSTIKFALATLSVVLTLGLGWAALGVRWDWASVRWGPLLVALPLGLTAALCLGFLVAGFALLLPRSAISTNEGVGVALFLICGVIFPVDLLPHGLREIALTLPFTWWYEALRRFVLGHGASALLGRWPDAGLLAMLAGTTALFALVSHLGYLALERRARQLGRLDQSTLF